jgi:hypothetical protein
MTIVYFDSSAFVELIVEETGSERALTRCTSRACWQ